MQVNPEKLQQALERPWKVDLGRDTRESLLAPPSHPWEFPLTLGREDSFRTAVGLDAGVRNAFEFSVTVRDSAGLRHTLTTLRLDPHAGEGSSWREIEVDLAAFARQSIELTLETKALGEWIPEEGFPAWGNPRIVRSPAGHRPPNVILVSIDTLRADHLSLYGYSRKTTPGIDSWARNRGVVFQNTIAAAPWTLPSHVSMLTGLDAVTHGVNYRKTTPEELTLLAEVLREDGYETFAVTGGGWLHPAFGLHQGFDVYRYSDAAADDEDLITRAVDEALLYIKSSAHRPFFLFFHTYETHEPFAARLPFFGELAATKAPEDVFVTYPLQPKREEGFAIRRWLTRRSESEENVPLDETEVATVIDVYDSKIAHADREISRLFSYLTESGLDQETVVVFTSDHGEAFGEKGLAGHAALYDFVLKVPLVLSLPDGSGAGQIRSRQVRLIDLVPTILDLTGIARAEPLDGTSLLPLIRDENADFPREAWSYATSSNLGLSLRLDNRLKYIFNHVAWEEAQGAEELYHLRKDPGEQHDLAAGAAELEVLRRRLTSFLDEKAHGIELSFVNDGDKPFGGYFWGDVVHPQTVKSWDLSCPCVHWRGREKGVGFTVPAKQRFSLLIPDTEAGSLEVYVLPEAREETAYRIDLAALSHPVHLELRGDSFVAVENKDLAAGIRISHRRPPAARNRPDGEENVPDDEGLIRQLRNLGYVE